MAHLYHILPPQGDPPGPPHDPELAVGEVDSSTWVFYDEQEMSGAYAIRTDAKLNLEKCR